MIVVIFFIPAIPIQLPHWQVFPQGLRLDLSFVLGIPIAIGTPKTNLHQMGKKTYLGQKRGTECT